MPPGPGNFKEAIFGGNHDSLLAGNHDWPNVNYRFTPSPAASTEVFYRMENHLQLQSF
jgi:hypothetical protein